MTRGVQVRAIEYWLRATVRPREAIAELKAQPDKVAVAFWVNLILAFFIRSRR